LSPAADRLAALKRTAAVSASAETRFSELVPSAIRTGALPARHSDIVAGGSAAMRVVAEVLELVELGTFRHRAPLGSRTAATDRQRSTANHGEGAQQGRLRAGPWDPAIVGASAVVIRSTGCLA
jgi:hypothetical protein